MNGEPLPLPTTLELRCTCIEVPHQDWCELNHPDHPCNESSCRFAVRTATTAITDDVREAFRAALNAREGVAEGRYCECAEPDLNGDALMCFACQLRNRDQELRRVHEIVDAHEFVPGKLRGLMCAVCTHLESDERHHGQPAVGQTSWGETVQGIVP